MSTSHVEFDVNESKINSCTISDEISFNMVAVRWGGRVLFLSLQPLWAFCEEKVESGCLVEGGVE